MFWVHECQQKSLLTTQHGAMMTTDCCAIAFCPSQPHQIACVFLWQFISRMFSFYVASARLQLGQKYCVFRPSEYLGLCYQSRKVSIHPLHRSPFNHSHTHSFSLLCFRRKTFINRLKLNSTRSFLVMYGCHPSTLIIQRSQWGP